jgi:diacylglycerol kinase family enzyme
MANETPTTQPASESEPTVPQNAETQAQVTDAKATIKIEGQSFELDAALAQEDKTLRVVLQPHFASIENANITREVKDGKLTVTIVKKAQHKGCR